MDKENRIARHACDLCRARKYKCSKERPSCQLCRQHKRPCHYTGQVVRSPLTRVHLTNVENRLQKLEALFARLLPDVNIDDAMSQTPMSSTFADLPSPLRLDDAKFLESPGQSREQTPPYEALPQEADGFDWKEETRDLDDLADGMASLSVEPSGIGYLGRRIFPNLDILSKHSQSVSQARPLVSAFFAPFWFGARVTTCPRSHVKLYLRTRMPCRDHRKSSRSQRVQ